MGVAPKIEYWVILRFSGETPEQFYERYPEEHPDHPNYRKADRSVTLRFA